MSKRITDLFSIAACFMLAFLLMLLWSSLVKAQPAQAGSGTAIVIPASTIIPVMDGVCSPTEYSDAVQVTVTVGTTETFPVYMKHTATDVYFCFGSASGLPLPNGGDSSVAIYIDPDNDGVDNPRDDFGVWMPYNPLAAPFAHEWGTTGYDGADPGGWQAVKHQIVSGTPLWQVEFRISLQTIQGFHPIGLALFYHWWRFVSDDYSWPAPGIWGAPQLFGNATILAPEQVYLPLTIR
jgi:hypothetical protein